MVEVVKRRGMVRRIVLAMLFSIVTMEATNGATGTSGEAAVEFDRRVKEYVALRDRLDTGAARLEVTASPEEIAAAQKALAARLRAARAEARHKDVFTPAVEAHFRQLLNPEMEGVRGQNTRGVIQDEGPGPDAFVFEVNGEYPKQQPLGSVPGNVLRALPPLPDGIEYRFVDRHLILRDTRANLIVDYIRNAIDGE